jgi:hypothetical protein
MQEDKYQEEEIQSINNQKSVRRTENTWIKENCRFIP